MKHGVVIMTLFVFFAINSVSYTNDKGLGFIKYPNKSTQYKVGYRVGHANAYWNYSGSNYFWNGFLGGFLLSGLGTGLVTVEGLNSSERPPLSKWADLKDKKTEYVIGYLDGYENLAHERNWPNALLGGIVGSIISAYIIIKVF